MKNASRRGLFHPDDIKTFGLASTPGPHSAPLQELHKVVRPGLSPVTPTPPSSAGRAHARSSSFAGSLGRAEAARTAQNQAEFERYTEEPDEDYEDVFGKLNSTGNRLNYCEWTVAYFRPPTSSRACHSDSAAEHTTFRQIMGQCR